DATGWATGQAQMAVIPTQVGAPDISGQWDASAWLQPEQSGLPSDGTQQWDWGTQTFDSGTYDATPWNSDGSAAGGTPDSYEPQSVPFDQQATATFQQTPGDEPDGHDAPADDLRDTGELPSVSLLDDQEEIAPASALRVAPRSGSRSRRRTPPKRSALLTVAVPSMCVMGGAGAATGAARTGGRGRRTPGRRARPPRTPRGARSGRAAAEGPATSPPGRAVARSAPA